MRSLSLINVSISPLSFFSKKKAMSQARQKHNYLDEPNPIIPALYIHYVRFYLTIVVSILLLAMDQTFEPIPPSDGPPQSLFLLSPEVWGLR